MKQRGLPTARPSTCRVRGRTHHANRRRASILRLTMQASGHQQLSKLLAFARADGISVLVLAGLGLVGSLATGQEIEALVCLAASTIGFLEFLTASKIKSVVVNMTLFHRLTACQLALAGLVMVYALWRLATLDPAELIKIINDYPTAKSLLAAYGSAFVVEEVLSLSLRLTYLLLIPLTLLLQGGIALHYFRSGKKITTTLAPPPIAEKLKDQLTPKKLLPR